MASNPSDKLDESDLSDAELPWSDHGSDLDENDGESDGALHSDPTMGVSDPGLVGPSDVKKRKVPGAKSKDKGTTKLRVKAKKDILPDWSEVTSEGTQIPTLSFTPSAGPALVNPGDGSPLDYFRHFVPVSFMKDMARASNLYVADRAKKCNPKTGKLPVWADKWDPLDETDSAELDAFIAAHIHMGVSSKPEIFYYWFGDDWDVCSPLREAMTYKRFQLLNRNFHVSCPDMDSGENRDRLSKVRPLLDLLNEKCKQGKVPPRELAVDEAMVGFRGRLSFLQYCPMKPTKRGIKVWVLACAPGYVYSFNVYTGKGDIVSSGTGQGLGASVVLNLTEPLHGQGYRVFCDRFFTSVGLTQELWEKGTEVCGTVLGGRKGLPDQAKKDKIKDAKLKQGQSVKFQREVTANEKSGMLFCTWMDKKPVPVLSSGIDHTDTVVQRTVDRSGKRVDVSCPLPIAEYNKHMGYVDHADQLRQYYELGRRSIRWWTYLFWYCIDTAICNAFILHCEANPGRKLSQLEFRRKLRDQLIAPLRAARSKTKSEPVSESAATSSGPPTPMPAVSAVEQKPSSQHSSMPASRSLLRPSITHPSFSNVKLKQIGAISPDLLSHPSLHTPRMPSPLPSAQSNFEIVRNQVGRGVLAPLPAEPVTLPADFGCRIQKPPNVRGDCVSCKRRVRELGGAGPFTKSSYRCYPCGQVICNKKDCFLSIHGYFSPERLCQF